MVFCPAQKKKRGKRIIDKRNFFVIDKKKIKSGKKGYLCIAEFSVFKSSNVSLEILPSW